MSNNIVWIAGTSGVGKETFINNLISNSSNTREILDISVDSELDIFGPGYKQPSIESLSGSQSSFVIVKWQFKTHNLIKKLAEIDSCNQKIVTLWRPFDMQLADLKKRSVWAENESESTLEHDWILIKRIMGKLRTEFSITVDLINASAFDYKTMKKWQ